MDDLVLVQNDQDRRSLEWLMREVGEERLVEAIKSLAGNRRPYVSNIAKVLQISIPKNMEYTPQVEARQHLEKLRELLRGL